MSRWPIFLARMFERRPKYKCICGLEVANEHSLAIHMFYCEQALEELGVKDAPFYKKERAIRLYINNIKRR